MLIIHYTLCYCKNLQNYYLVFTEYDSDILLAGIINILNVL